MADTHERSIVVRYRPAMSEGWPWAISNEGEEPVLTITDLDDSSLGIVLRAIVLAGDELGSEPGAPSAREHELAAS